MSPKARYLPCPSGDCQGTERAAGTVLIYPVYQGSLSGGLGTDSEPPDPAIS